MLTEEQKKIIGKLNNRAVGELDRDVIQKVINKIANLLECEEFNIYDLTNELENRMLIKDIMHSEQDIQVMCFNICNCSPISVLESKHFIFKFHSELPDTTTVVSVEDFKYFELDKILEELVKIKNIQSWKSFDKKVSLFKSFKKKYLKNIKDNLYSNSSELLSLYYAIKDELKINKEVINYNHTIDDIICTTKYAQQCKILLTQMPNSDSLGEIGYIEIETGENSYEEIVVSLSADFCSVYQNDKDPRTYNVGYEGTSIFADAYLTECNLFYPTKLRQFGDQIYKNVNNCKTLTEAYEISRTGNFEMEEAEPMMNADEVVLRLKKQMYLLEKNADIIFIDLYKILTIIQTQIKIKEVI